MPEKPHEFHFHSEAETELRTQARRIGSTRKLLRRLAKTIAGNDTSLPEELVALVERKHVIQATEILTRTLAGAKESMASGSGVFLSYSTKDEDLVHELEGDLRNQGVSCFLAPLSIKPGAAWPEEIWQALRGCRALVLIVTAEAVKSKWCLLEIGAAFGLQKRIVAVLRHTSKLPDVLKSVQAMKVQTKKQLADLVQHLRQLASA